MLTHVIFNVDFEERKSEGFIWKTKFLLLHGTNDEAVSIEEPRELHDKFLEHNINHVFIEYNGDNHGIRKNAEHASNQINTWFLKYVKDGMKFEEVETRYIVPKK